MPTIVNTEYASDTDSPMCRVCLMDDSEEELCQPCACRGTQAWVHPKCLAMWQHSPSGGDRASRRSICPVCRNLYASQYLPRTASPSLPSSCAGSDWSKSLCQVLLCAALFPMLVLVVSLLLGERRGDGPSGGWISEAGIVYASGSVGAALGLVGAARALGTWLLRLIGVRLCFVVDEHGAPLLRVVRVGYPVRGLAAGALLVATDRIGGGFFERTVLLITHHSAEGTLGFILNAPITPRAQGGGRGWRAGAHGEEFEAGAPLRHALALPEEPDAVMHGMGGPVDISPMASLVIHAFGGGGEGGGREGGGRDGGGHEGEDGGAPGGGVPGATLLVSTQPHLGLYAGDFLSSPLPPLLCLIPSCPLPLCPHLLPPRIVRRR